MNVPCRFNYLLLTVPQSSFPWTSSKTVILLTMYVVASWNYPYTLADAIFRKCTISWSVLCHSKTIFDNETAKIGETASSRMSTDRKLSLILFCLCTFDVNFSLQALFDVSTRLRRISMMNLNSFTLYLVVMSFRNCLGYVL